MKSLDSQSDLPPDLPYGGGGGGGGGSGHK